MVDMNNLEQLAAMGQHVTLSPADLQALISQAKSGAVLGEEQNWSVRGYVTLAVSVTARSDDEASAKAMALFEPIRDYINFSTEVDAEECDIDDVVNDDVEDYDPWA